MRIIGFDPGLATTGFGLIQKEKQTVAAIKYGIITTKSTIALPARLRIIYTDARKILRETKPDIIAIEEIFFAANSKTAIAVGHARGVILLASAMQNVRIASYTPLQVKQALTRYGRADKKQIQRMAQMILNLLELPKPDDAADALAIALTCAHHDQYPS